MTARTIAKALAWATLASLLAGAVSSTGVLDHAVIQINGESLEWAQFGGWHLVAAIAAVSAALLIALLMVVVVVPLAVLVPLLMVVLVVIGIVVAIAGAAAIAFAPLIAAVAAVWMIVRLVRPKRATSVVPGGSS